MNLPGSEFVEFAQGYDNEHVSAAEIVTIKLGISSNQAGFYVIFFYSKLSKNIANMIHESNTTKLYIYIFDNGSLKPPGNDFFYIYMYKT